MLDGVLGQQSGVVGGATGHHEDLSHLAQLVIGQTLLVQNHATVKEVTSESVAHGGRLLEDLLHHEGIKATLFRSFQIPIDGEWTPLDLVT